MADTLVLLRLEHQNLSDLLGLIENQVTAADQGAALDMDLLILAWEYFSDYPDLCHHPKEDLVYDLFSRRDPGSCAGLRNLIADHARLHKLTADFGEALRHLREDAPTAEPAARAVIREFTQRYRQHMAEEDERFFVLAEERLSSDDWATLDFATFDRDDPLFDHAVEKRFSALRQRIEALDKEGKARGSAFDIGNRLRGLSGIESINELMRSARLPFRLTRFTEGGYGLESQRELLLYIPECSAERAAWCAYCHLVGRGWPWTQRQLPSVP
jgi:hemerythrin-like domain-containing protein